MLCETAKKQKLFGRVLVALILLAIYFFGAYLRYEDFIEWDKYPQVYQFDDEYMMANYDSYLYLSIARSIYKGDYQKTNPLRRVPFGVSQPAIPPLLSLSTATLAKYFSLPLNKLAVLFPAFLAPLLAFILYLCARDFALNQACSLLAAFLAMISYTYVVRSRVGVFDTDCLNVSLLWLNTTLAYRYIDPSGKVRINIAILLFSSTLCFALWWHTASFIAFFSTLASVSLCALLKSEGENKKRFILIFGCCLLLLIILYSKQLYALFEILINPSPLSLQQQANITELEPVSLPNFIKGTTGQVVLFLMSMIGIILMMFHKPKVFMVYLIPMMLCFSPLFMGNRFMIFSAPALALGAGFLLKKCYDKFPIHPNPALGVGVAVMVCLSLYPNFDKITDKLNPPAISEMTHLLHVLKNNTQTNSNIWTSWPLGYPIQYYLKRGTYADGELSDGSNTLQHLSLPLVSGHLKFSANFIQFYTHSDINKLYQLFETQQHALDFLRRVLSKSPSTAKEYLSKQLKENSTLQQADFKTIDDWLSYLYPKGEKKVYLLLHQRMLKTMSWFRQGSIVFHSGDNQPLPFYLSFGEFQQKGPFLANDVLVVNLEKGLSKHRNGSLNSYDHILICRFSFCDTQRYRHEQIAQPSGEHFTFIWNEQNRLGAAMSKAVSDTAFVRLYLRGERSAYFKLISSSQENYQLWEVQGDSYET